MASVVKWGHTGSNTPKAGVDGSNPPGGTREYDGVARAAPFLVCGGRRRIRAVDARVTNMGRISSSSARATLPVARIIRAASVRIVCATHPVRGRPKT